MLKCRKLVLFDIDGTLVLTGGAGMRAMNRACEEIIGHADALQDVPLAGRTDWIILHDTLSRIGHALDDRLFARVEGQLSQTPDRRDSRAGSRREGRDARRPRCPRGVGERATTSSSDCSPETSNRARASSSNTSISGATSAAAHTETTRRIETRWCPSPSSARERTVFLCFPPIRSSSSETRRTMSPARSPSAPCLSLSRPEARASITCARAARRSCFPI